MSLWVIRDACWARATIEASPFSPWRPSFRRAAWHAVTPVAVVLRGMRTKHRERQRSSVRVKLKQLPRGWKTAGQVSMPHTASWLIEVANFAIANHCDLQWLHRTHHWPTSLHTLWLQTSLVNDFINYAFPTRLILRKTTKSDTKKRKPMAIRQDLEWRAGQCWRCTTSSLAWMYLGIRHTCRNYLVTMATRKEPQPLPFIRKIKANFLAYHAKRTWCACWSSVER